MKAFVIVHYSACPLSEIIDLVREYEGYFDGDRRCVIFHFHDALVEELDNRGIRFKVVVLL